MPHQPRAAATSGPVDRALGHLIEGNFEAALRWVAPTLGNPATRPVGLLIAGVLLAAGRPQAAVATLRASVVACIEAGNLPLAVAACNKLGELGEDPSSELAQIAETFGRGSPRVAGGSARPPSLPAAAAVPEPLADTLAGDALVARIADLAHSAASNVTVTADPLPPQPMFSSLAPDPLGALLASMSVEYVPRAHVLIEQGAPGEEVYVLARGEVEVRRHTPDGDTILLARLGNRAVFGEMALLSRNPRAASVVADRPCIVLVEKRGTLDQVALHAPEIATELARYTRRRMVENLVRTSPILAAISESERPALIDRFLTKTFEAGESLIVQGRKSEGLHLIASGQVAVVHRGETDRTLIAELGAGEVVGEVSLVLRRPSNADVVATHPTVTLHLPSERFLEIAKAHPALLAELYELSVQRDEETEGLITERTTMLADDFVVL